MKLSFVSSIAPELSLENVLASTRDEGLGGKNPASPLREFQTELFHRHAKDVKIRRDRIDDVGIFAHPLEWHQPRIPGYGEMNWNHFMSALMETTYRGPVCIEVEDDTFGRTLAGRKAAVHPTHNFLKPCIPMKYTYEELAGMIDHSLLQPWLSDAELKAGCEIAAKYQVASVCIKPYAVKDAAVWLQGTGVKVGCVIGFPHGNSATESKRYETELACRDGAVEIDMVINVGKAMSGDWAFVEADVKAVCDEAHRHGAKVKVIFENDYLGKGGAGLSGDDFKRKLCEICERAGADWVKTSTGYGFAKQPDGRYNYQGATEHDLKLMRASCSPKVQVKAAGGVRDLDGLIMIRDLGATRCGASATVAILDEYQRREALEQAGVAVEPSTAKIGTGGY
jgi:deoxyribose-phosphate aldolase